MKYPVILFSLIISILHSQMPIDYKFSKRSNLNRFENITDEGLKNNSIVDIRYIDESYLLLSTANGLSYAYIYDSHLDSVSFGYFNSGSVSLPRGGIPALAVREDVIALSGLLDTIAVTGKELMGTGISYSIDEGENWTYLPQPKDEIPELGAYHTVLWGGQEISALAVTTEINNISYDLAIGGDYIYAASWAGGLRRYGPLSSDIKSWQIIPMPMDSDTSLVCEGIDLNAYELNPNDPVNNGNHNHKGFSVYVINDTVWAGTANGINKGIIESGCINWEHHYTSVWDNISGNWVIGFANQTLANGSQRFWAITWAGDGNNEKHALSYTDNGGESWYISYPSGNSEKVYNLYTNESRIWAASESGLYVSEDGEHWEKYSRLIDTLTGEEILSESVLAVYHQDNWLWLGTVDGIGIINAENEITTTIHRFWETANQFSVFPNPFLINDYNVVGNDGHVRFVYSNPNGLPGKIDVFDFSMDKVIHLVNSNPFTLEDNQNEMIWNGRNEYGEKISNGVYFCRLFLNGKYSWTKLAVIN